MSDSAKLPMPTVKVYGKEVKEWFTQSFSQEVSYLEGRLLTLMEAMFNDPEQRKAAKDIIRQSIWSWQRDVAQPIFWDEMKDSKQ